MNYLTKLALAGFAIAAIAPAAHASHVINITGSSGTFGNPTVGCVGAVPCSFADTFTFDAPAGFNLQSADITSTAASSTTTDPTNLNFTSVTLNGVEFDIESLGRRESRSIFDQLLLATGNTIIVEGTTNGQAAYSGTLSFATSAVPEPATWAMMIGGFGLVGGAMRSSRRRTNVTYATA